MNVEKPSGCLRGLGAVLGLTVCLSLLSPEVRNQVGQILLEPFDVWGNRDDLMRNMTEHFAQKGIILVPAEEYLNAQKYLAEHAEEIEETIQVFGRKKWHTNSTQEEINTGLVEFLQKNKDMKLLLEQGLIAIEANVYIWVDNTMELEFIIYGPDGAPKIFIRIPLKNPPQVV